MGDSVSSSSSGARSARAVSQLRSRGGRFSANHANALLPALQAQVRDLQAQAETSTNQYTDAQTELDRLRADLQAAANQIEVLGRAADNAKRKALAANASKGRAQTALREQQRQLFDRAQQNEKTVEEVKFLKDMVKTLEVSVTDAEVQRDAAQAEAAEHLKNVQELSQRLEQASADGLRLEAQVRRAENDYAVALLNLSERHAIARRAAGDSSRPLRPVDIRNDEQERRKHTGAASLRAACFTAFLMKCLLDLCLRLSQDLAFDMCDDLRKTSRTSSTRS